MSAASEVTKTENNTDSDCVGAAKLTKANCGDLASEGDASTISGQVHARSFPTAAFW